MFLNKARASPRVTPGGGLEWYHGDVFKIVFGLTVQDQHGYPVVLGSGSKIDLRVIQRGEVVHSEVFTDFPATSITWHISEELTAKLTPGKYTVRMVVTHAGNVTTTNNAELLILE